MPRISSTILFALLCVWLGVSPRAVLAQDAVRGVGLNWVRLPGAEACIPPVELAARVERRLGRSVFVRTADAIIVIEGRVGAVPSGGFEMALVVSDPDGHTYGSRELQVPGNDCGKLSELAALIVSITIRHEGASAGIELPAEVEAQLAQLFAEEPAELDPRELPASAGAPSAHAPSPPPAAARVPPVREWFMRAQAGARLGTGLTPRATVGPFLQLGAARSGWGSAAVGGSFGWPQAQRVPAETRGQLRYQPWQLALSACIEALRSQALELSLCAEGGFGEIGVAASEFQVNRSVSKLFVELIPAAALRAIVWGPGYVQMRLGAPLRVVRPAFEYQSSAGESRLAYTVARVGVLLELGVGVEL